MPTLIEAQKTINADPVVTCTVGGVEVGAYIGRYKWWEKADSFGRMALWLDNSGGRFNNLASDWPAIKRGREVVLSRGLRVEGVSLTAAAPTFWVETLLFVLYKDTPFLVLDCIDWVGRLRYFRYAETQSWSATQVQTIISSLLNEVGLTLDSGSFTSLAIDYEVRPTRSLWSAVREVRAKVPEVLFAKPGKVIGFKRLDSGEAASYTFAYNPASSEGHPLLDDTDVAESTALYNSITVVGGPELEYSGAAENTGEINLIGYRRRRTITDRRLNSDAECEQRAEAELEFWNARGTAGVIVARPHFTARLFEVVSAPAPLWGGPAVGSGHITKITEWYNFGSRKYDQALVLGEVPDAAILHVLDPDDEEPIPLEDDDPGDAGGGPENGDSSTGPGGDGIQVVETDLEDQAVTSTKLADGAVTSAKLANGAVTAAKLAAGAVGTAALADNSISQAKLQNGSVGTAELQDSAVTAAKIAGGAVDTAELAAGAVTSSKIADGAITAAKLAAGALDSTVIADGAITTAKLADDAVTGAKISGDIGLGAAQASPQGLLHGYGAYSGFLHWEANGVAGTTQTIVPNGSGDVLAALCAQYVLKASAGTPGSDWQAGVVTLEPNTSTNLYNEADGTLQFRVTSAGVVEVQRTAGTSTFKIALWLVWI